MSQLTVRCIKAAFIYLALGIALGASFAIDRSLGPSLRPLHAELNLWGWVTILIYGMGYHMLPRFTGRPLASPRLADIQSWLAIGGVRGTAPARGGREVRLRSRSRAMGGDSEHVCSREGQCG